MKHYYPPKKICSNLTTNYITDADYMLGKRFCKEFEIKSLGEYYDLYLRSDVLLLADVFWKTLEKCV